MKIRTQSGTLALALAAGVLCTLGSLSEAAVVFTEDFNGYSGGTQNATQFETGLLVSHSGNLAGWDKTGGGVVHAVDKDGAGDYAALIWQDNVITLTTGLAANDSLVTYTIEFAAGPTVYAAGDQATAATDGMVIEILRGNNSVLASFTSQPGAWASAQTFTPASFAYVGDGTGPVRLRVKPLAAAGRFAGAIDNLRLSRGAVAFAENFNGYFGGNQNSLQFETGLKVSHSGNLPGWDKVGGGVVHAVDRNGVGDYAAMIWQDNVITLTSPVAANQAGAEYTVEFLGGPAVYAAGSQASAETDGIVIEVLRGDGSALAAMNYQPGAWASAQTVTPASFGYTGDGTGPVRVRVGPLLAEGRFGGAVDDLKLWSDAGAASLPTITTQPVGGTVVQGDDFTFTVVSSDLATYQWQKNGTPIAGANSATYRINDVKLTDAGTYKVVLRNAAGPVESDGAVLVVTAAPTFPTYDAAVLADNPIHYYRLDETSGSTAGDLGSLATAGGTYLGGYTLGQASATPLLGGSLRLDGTPGTLVDLGVFHPGDNVTVEAWVNLDPTANQNPAYHIVVGRWDGSYELDIAPGDFVNFNVRRDGNGFGQAIGATAIARGQWHHLVGVFGGGVATVYVNGVKGSEAAVGGVLQDAGPSPDRVMIGATRSGTVSSFNWKGSIDEVAIYDYALTPAQIRSHARSVQAAPPALTIQSAVIVSWPSFPPGYVLRWAVDINGPYTDYPGSIYAEGNSLIAPVVIGPTQRFFHLFKP